MSQWLLVFAILFTVTISSETKDVTDFRRYRDLKENTNVDDILQEFQGMQEYVKKLSKAIERAELTCLQKEDNSGWSSYSLWSECTETCGGGTQTRTRTCSKSFISKHAKGVAACNGCSVQTQACNITPCPVNGGWSKYGAWTSCNKPCGTGQKTRSRTCTNPSPSEGGSACKGSATQSDVCNAKPCPVNGAWSQYGDWTRCTKTCGRGTQTRSRTCTNPSPSAGGSACKGSSVQSKNCNENLCPVCPLGWKSYGSSCYFFSQTTATWNDAKRKCITKSSMLAEVVSYGERDFLRKQASEYAETFWLGGTDSKNEGSWIWATSQSNFIVTGWHTRLVKEPNNLGGNENCNNIHKNLDFEWNDDSCLKSYRYICEKLLV
ncbi:Hemicentin-1,Coadhesin,Adhesion G protein-coupled receptor B3,Thrombospondin-2,Thrombospondin-1 [Mytilus edulis]|uniref:Hemicentin-1,Coadhesin,Adhesion G protein-coupled receptor B3,Thrombospondin-2,Thrombospondin-1 n=1 Tax=Mytilus edulis TaxID=6550 RepID=A0A8S3TPQ7_MYTED|nr:Hemicentin-1,Coadhesin,Adhesion G protein-coupled receptor B3,Thrombospondin-2,Thrombospondin-1 [Mytilus edulis]